jgi:GTPase Era involved in 16S rRNA processing
MTRRELEQINEKRVFLDLSVETDPHWPERLQ